MILPFCSTPESSPWEAKLHGFSFASLGAQPKT
jgi:hypothetical protein